MKMTKVLASIPLLLLSGSVQYSPAFASETAFLKEILQGRCYERPPTGSLDECPTVVGSFMGVLESKLDADIQMKDFDAYLEAADLSSPTDGALIWQAFLGDNDDKTNTDDPALSVSPPPELVTPQDTPGGALVRDLVFCGVDQRDNCSVETSNAYWKFWQAAYSNFVASVKGRLQFIIEPKADVVFLEKSIVSQLGTNKDVTSVTVYAMEGCSTKAIASFVETLQATSISGITCKNDIVEFVLCQTPESVECTNYLKSTVGTTDDDGNGDGDKQDATTARSGDATTTKDYYVASAGEETHADKSDAKTVEAIENVPSSSTTTAAVDESDQSPTTDSSGDNRHRHYFVKLFLVCGALITAVAFVLMQRKRLGYHSVGGNNKYVPTAGQLPQ